MLVYSSYQAFKFKSITAPKIAIIGVLEKDFSVCVEQLFEDLQNEDIKEKVKDDIERESR